MKTTKHPSVISLLEKIIAECTVTARGTYNRQDPTSYERGETSFEYRGIAYSFEYHDCTWGAEIRIERHIPGVRWDYIGGFSITWGFGSEKSEVSPLGCQGLLPLLAMGFRYVMRPDFVSKREREYMESAMREPDPFGCLADYE